MTDNFLYKVAKDLKQRVGKDMADIAVIFPNKRAALFFNKYLVKDEKEPVWSPKYLTISELFRNMQPGTTVPDSIELVCRLYKCYCKVLDSRKEEGAETIESLDYFYQWGETLLSDFDDIDKNMADARKLLANINDWNQLESNDFIDEEQEENIKRFFKGFSVENMSTLRKRFLDMWNSLYDIYFSFNKDLTESNMAYEGKLYRSIIENLEIEKLECSKYVFVGFNVLDNVETRLFEKLDEAGKAVFYWDYSKRLMENNEAGKFLKNNIDKFPNALQDTEEPDFSNKEIVIISSKTNNIQAKYARQWISENLTEEECETAVILCDESQLQPVLHSIPDNVKCINITMGYPLSETPAMSFVQLLVNMQAGYDNQKKTFAYNSVSALLKHPYASILSSNSSSVLKLITGDNIFYPTPALLYTVDGKEDNMLKSIFTPQTDNISLCAYLADAVKNIARKYTPDNGYETSASEEVEAERRLYRQLYGESLFRIYTTLTRFSNLIENGLLSVEREMLVRLIKRLLQGITIPFHGEPAIGLQLMGMLETRNLDFRNILMLGVNEGMLPKASEIPSFIPPTIRQAFGMTTIDRRIAVFAFYFYRLLQRGEKIYYVYNDETGNNQKGEMSRFLLQLLAESGLKIKKMSITSKTSLNTAEGLSVKRSDKTLEALKRRFAYTESKTDEVGWINDWLSNHSVQKAKHEGEKFKNRYIMSPSAINTYIDCQLKFYFKYIAGLKIKEDVTVDIDSAMFGTIFHNTAEEIYNRLTSKNNVILSEDLKLLIDFQTTGGKAENSKLFSIEPIIDFYFRKEFFKQKELKDISSYLEQQEKGIVCPEVNYNGIQIINKEVIYRLIVKLLKIDSNLGDFNYLGSEINISRTESIKTANGEEIKINVGGNIDRLDYIGNSTIRVIDYKTGTKEHRTSDLADIFIQSKERSGYHLQTFIYTSILCDIIDSNVPIKPALLYIQKQDKDNSPVLKIGSDEITDFRIFKKELDKMLNSCLTEMFSTEGEYSQTEIADNCKYCDFRKLCKR